MAIPAREMELEQKHLDYIIEVLEEKIGSTPEIRRS